MKTLGRHFLKLLLYVWTVSLQGQQSQMSEPEFEGDADILFFDAQIQKAIGNLDRAVVLMEKALEGNADVGTINHELARLNLATGNILQAQNYALNALKSNPDQYWFLDTFLKTIAFDFDLMKQLAPNLPYDRSSFRISLAKIYLEAQNPEAALSFLEGEETGPKILHMRIKVKEFLAKEKPVQRPVGDESVNTEESAVLMEQIKGLLELESLEQANKLALEAIDKFPLQPFFYFAAGKSFLALKDISSAREWLEIGETLLIQQDQMSQQIYALLAEICLEQGDETAYRAYKNKLN